MQVQIEEQRLDDILTHMSHVELLDLANILIGILSLNYDLNKLKFVKKEILIKFLLHNIDLLINMIEEYDEDARK